MRVNEKTAFHTPADPECATGTGTYGRNHYHGTAKAFPANTAAHLLLQDAERDAMQSVLAPHSQHGRQPDPMLTKTWLVPFIFLGAMLAFYLFAPESRRADIQKRMRNNLNFLIILDLVLVVMGIAAFIAWRTVWIGWATWIALPVMLAVGIHRSVTPEPPPPPSAFDYDEGKGP